MDLPAPMLPVTGRLPMRPGWAYEVKWDGIRVIAGIAEDGFQLATRRGRDIADRFPDLAVITRIGDAVLDGELVVLTDERPDFGAVLTRMNTKRATRAVIDRYPATVMVFDLLRFHGEDLRGRPFRERRAALETLELPDAWAVPPISEDAAAMTAASAAHGFEGVVAKRLNSTYVSGRTRDRAWVKMRHRTAIDALVVGWTERADHDVTLLLAEKGPEGLAYIGQCAAPRSVAASLAPLAVMKAEVPVRGAPRGVHWVRPELPVEVTAPSRMPDGRLRHPKFLRVRPDALG